MVDFDDDVSLAEKLVQYGVGIVELVEQKLLRHEIGTTEEIVQKLLLDNERESDCCRVRQNAVGGWSLEDSIESAAMQRRRGAGGVALLVLQEGSASGRGG
ncbi:hypothetical protein BHM03_00007371 [Ensete ventricosum]|nr:hypothetical protein BHM03_00007371 [Ensete ventricosum]